MIINLEHFISVERPYWEELEYMLLRLERNPERRMDMGEIKRFHYLYQRVSSSLSRLSTFSAEPQTHRWLESLMARAYAEMHESHRRSLALAPLAWFFHTLPQTFRRHVRAFWLSLLIMSVGALFGVLAVAFDPGARSVIIPFDHLQGSASERVRQEEIPTTEDHLAGRKSTGTAMYFTHNTRVSFFTIALGALWGIGTIVLLFYNGVIIGAIAIDYMLSKETVFLLAWLMPHGVIEIPAIIIAGQAGLLLARTMIGRGTRQTLAARFQLIRADLVTLCFGVAIMLAWAGFIEAWVSQYHEPVLPYTIKIGFAMVELSLLAAFLFLGGRRQRRENRSV